MPQFTSDGLDLAYDEFGPSDARKAVVLVHGFSANKYENWKRMGWYDAIGAKGMRGLAIDNRGHGESAKPHEPEKYDSEAMARDVFALMDHAGVERAHIVGFSMGSHIALTAALLDGGRIDHLVVSGIGARLLRKRTNARDRFDRERHLIAETERQHVAIPEIVDRVAERRRVNAKQSLLRVAGTETDRRRIERRDLFGVFLERRVP